MHRIGFVLLLAVAPSLFASEVVPGVHLIRGKFTPGSQPDGNTIVLTGADGLVVIDTGRHAAHTQAIVDHAKAAKLPVKAVVNTHWHLDHIGGNATMRREFTGVQIVASGALANARRGFLANYRKQLEELIANESNADAQQPFRNELAIIDAGDALAPDVVITASGPRTLAGRDLHLGLESRAVTEGDLWVLDAKSGVLVAGDLVTLPAPFLDTACPSRWQETLDRLAKQDFDLLIPGHGAPLTRRQFGQYRNGFARLRACAASDATKETCIDGWIADVGALMPGTNPRFTRNLMDYYVDLLRRDPSTFAALCGN